MASFQGVGTFSPDDFTQRVKTLQALHDSKVAQFQAAANRAHQTAMHTRAQQASAQQQLQAMRMEAAKHGLKMSTGTEGGVNIPFLGNIGGRQVAQFDPDPDSHLFKMREMEAERARILNAALPEDIRQRQSLGEEQIRTQSVKTDIADEELRGAKFEQQLRENQENLLRELAQINQMDFSGVGPGQAGPPLSPEAQEAQRETLREQARAKYPVAARRVEAEDTQLQGAKAEVRAKESDADIREIRSEFESEVLQGKIDYNDAMTSLMKARADKEKSIESGITSEEIASAKIQHGAGIEVFRSKGVIPEGQEDLVIRSALALAKAEGRPFDPIVHIGQALGNLQLIEGTMESRVSQFMQPVEGPDGETQPAALGEIDAILVAQDSELTFREILDSGNVDDAIKAIRTYQESPGDEVDKIATLKALGRSLKPSILASINAANENVRLKQLEVNNRFNWPMKIRNPFSGKDPGFLIGIKSQAEQEAERDEAVRRLNVLLNLGSALGLKREIHAIQKNK